MSGKFLRALPALGQLAAHLKAIPFRAEKRLNLQRLPRQAGAVELEGGRVLAPACHRRVEGGMVVHTKSERVTRSVRTLVEMLMADQPPYSAEGGEKGSCDLEALARELGVLTNGGPRLSARPLAPLPSIALPSLG